VGHLVVLLGGLVSAVAGVLAMSIGTFLASRAQRQLYETELERERREIREHPGEEIAELMAALVGRGMPRGDAVEVARRIARYPELLLATLGIFELGVAPQRLGTPVRDAFVMAAAFGVASLVPSFPWCTLAVNLVGSFLIGLVQQAATEALVIGEDARLFLTAGVMGGLTTYSAFSYESVRLFETGATWQAWLNVVVTTAA